MGFWSAIVGGRRGWRAARYERRVSQIEALGPALRLRSDEELSAASLTLRQRARSGEPLDALLVEAFALGREASARVLGMRPFDVQLQGGMALHDGLIAEMKTGEGKTLVATLPAYLNALCGDGVHIVTVNDYLAARDAEWMGALYRFLGLEVGVILEEMGEDEHEEYEQRRAAYGCDITYGTNHEIAFDYLRDNLATSPAEVVQRGFSYAIVDEVDFLLIDEARTPLVISGAAEENPMELARVTQVVRRLQEGSHFIVEAKTRTAALTELGFDRVSRELGVESLCDFGNTELYRLVHQALLAHGVFKRDVDYIVDGDEVQIVDEFTGRVSEDKRFADGLHQALEAKEQVSIKAEDRTLAKITYQTFFGRYRKLAGMTGTAWSERQELAQTYGRDVQRIPTNRPTIRRDWDDRIYETLAAKQRAVVREIERRRASGQPVLVGTTSIRESEELARRLSETKIPFALLNAKNHEREAAIIAQAGRKAAVTISTNMAGRGVDILLGGNAELMALDEARHAAGGVAAAEVAGHLDPARLETLRQRCAREREEVVAAGGLHVIGTARHESSRIDDQLRGRAGRQGDPGSSQFFLSLEDTLWQRFGQSEIIRLRSGLRRDGHRADEPIERPDVRRLLRALQSKVEIENQAIRRDVLKYDLVVHVQREKLYQWRRTLVEGQGFDAERLVAELASDLLDGTEDDASLVDAFFTHFQAHLDLTGVADSELQRAVTERALEVLRAREAMFGREALYEAGRLILLAAIDDLFTDHLSNLERVEEGIGLHGYGGSDPLLEWQRQAAQMWRETLRAIRGRAVTLWFLVALEPLSASLDATPADATVDPSPAGPKRGSDDRPPNAPTGGPDDRPPGSFHRSRRKRGLKR